MSSTAGYHRHYEVPLLDDMHNYFPELLYGDLNQFRSVADVLQYMRNQVRRRFDLYSSAAASRAAAEPAPAAPMIPPTTPIRPRTAAAAATTHGFSLAPPNLPPRVRVRENLLSSLWPPVTPGASILDLASLLMASGNGLGATTGGLAPPDLFMEPVIVRPTPQQIDENTVIEIVDAEEDVCAICQDVMPPGSQARNLTYCDHRFHVGCIDTWFQRDVHCPVCRHDVREVAAEGAPARAQRSPSTPTATEVDGDSTDSEL